MPVPQFADHRRHVWALLRSALAAADPGRALEAHLEAVGDVSHYAHCWMAAFGKASLTMALALESALGDQLDGGVVAAMADLVGASTRYQILPAAHPLPDERNVAAAQAIAHLARNVGPDDVLICLISGGGSAHLTLPVRSISLDDLRCITDHLLRAGAPIQDLNAVRKHCEQLKGGGLGRLAAPAHIVTLILSDVIGDHLDVIASGPTVPDPTTYQDAVDVLTRYDALAVVPAVTRHLEAGVRGDYPDTPKPGEPVLSAVRNIVIGSNAMAVQAAAKRAESLGFATQVAAEPAVGEARELGEGLGAMVRAMPRPGCTIVGGETTVTVRGGGRGGRNQEIALAAALAIDGTPNVVVASFATDGIDGPTDVAGAFVTGETGALARQADIDLRGCLNDNDSYTCLQALNALLFTGATGTNVNDLSLILVY